VLQEKVKGPSVLGTIFVDSDIHRQIKTICFTLLEDESESLFIYYFVFFNVYQYALFIYYLYLRNYQLG